MELGLALRIFSFSFTSITSAVFSIIDKHKFSNVDLWLSSLLYC